MSDLIFSENKLKELLKAALTEVLQEQRDLFAEVLAEVLEDFALTKAVKEGEASDLVSREVIFDILQTRQ